MVAIINPENVGDKRGADVIIGRIDGTRNQLQFGDGSIYYEDDAECYNGKSANLRPKSLYENYHEQFAEWCRKRHQVISADLNLSMTDIATFRMWQKVVFSGRMWIVRKLTITIYAGNGRVDVSGEFVSVD